MVADKKSEATLAREFGERALVVHCVPGHEAAVKAMLLGIKEQDIYSAMSKVHGEGVGHFEHLPKDGVPHTWFVCEHP